MWSVLTVVRKHARELYGMAPALLLWGQANGRSATRCYSVRRLNDSRTDIGKGILSLTAGRTNIVLVNRQPYPRATYCKAASHSSKPEGKRTKKATDPLLLLPGVGARNQQLLRQNNLLSLDDLRKLHWEQHSGDRERSIEYLKEQVKFRYRSHCQSLVDAVIEAGQLKDKAQQEPEAKCVEPSVTLSLEGNIGAGKSTFLRYIGQADPELGQALQVVPEPVDKWQNIVVENNPDTFNILDAFYKEPSRYAYTFQNYIFITRLMQERDSRGTKQPMRLLERSVFSDRMVFVRKLQEDGCLNKMEMAVYDSWFEPILKEHTALVPDGFVYLKANPDTCLRRLTHRSRLEEVGVKLDYLEGLHDKHEEWLNDLPPLAPVVDYVGADVVSPSKLSPVRQGQLLLPPPPSLKDVVHLVQVSAVGYLGPTLGQIPALVLDINDDFDVNHDIDRQRDLANKVKVYYEYVENLKTEKQRISLQRRPDLAYESQGRQSVVLRGSR